MLWVEVRALDVRILTSTRGEHDYEVSGYTETLQSTFQILAPEAVSSSTGWHLAWL